MLELNKIHNGDWIKLAEQLDDESIDLIFTSPPYWGLRDYGIEGQIGLEEHPNEYIKQLVDGFRILRNKLKKTGSFYLNLGDTYFGQPCGNPEHLSKTLNNSEEYSKNRWKGIDKKPFRSGEPDPKLPERLRAREQFKGKKSNWLQPKQLMLMPSRVAIALQEDGWILRNDNIWHKPNPMPSSVKDRLNTTYEHIFHFVKSRKYYYDLDAIREPHSQESLDDLNRRKSMRFITSKDAKTAQKGLKIGDGGDRLNRTRDEFFNEKGKNPGDVVTKDSKYIEGNASSLKDRRDYYRSMGLPEGNIKGKNPGDFMSINTQPFPAAHFAVFPPEILIKPLKSSCPDGGTVLDPFSGSGTVAVVCKHAHKFGIKKKLNYLGFELSMEYVKIAEMRLRGCQGWQFKEAEKSKSLKELFQ